MGVVHNIAEFLLEDGRRMVVHPFPNVDPLQLRTMILGPVMAALLRQRGYAVLHGASIVINDGAVVFLGSCGAGKSTTASLFYAAGYGVGGDDVCAVDLTEDPVVHPSYPQIKLRKDAAHALHGNVAHLQPLYWDDVRRLEDVWTDFPLRSLPLKKVYILRFGDHTSLLPISKHDALLHLIQHARAIPPLSGKHYEQERMQQAATIAEKVPVALLTRPHAISQATNVVEMVRKDLAQLPTREEK